MPLSIGLLAPERPIVALPLMLNGGVTMLYYRLYFMDPRTGHIDRFAEFEAPDDAAALSLANEHIGGNPLELWCEHRKVQRIEARAPVAAMRKVSQPGL